jgi:hypothetical protein
VSVREYIASLSDDDLIKRTGIAMDDLTEASHKQNNSEWHQSCFAATVLYCEEMSRRGLKVKPTPP